MRAIWTTLKGLVFIFVFTALILPAWELGDSGTALLLAVAGLWIVAGIKTPYRYLTRPRW